MLMHYYLMGLQGIPIKHTFEIVTTGPFEGIHGNLLVAHYPTSH